ncbi:MAG: MBL fold metallo-hydrolase [Candidatus Woesearchaeota archaeon]
MIQINALSTGSCGNCYLVKYRLENVIKYIMIDCGFSYKQLSQMLEKEQISFEQITHLIITHEHSDHIKGLEQTLKLHPHLQLIISKGTNEVLNINFSNTQFISNNQKIIVESTLTITGIQKAHDGREPLSFTIEDTQHQKRIAIFTDLGEFNPIQCNILQLSDIVFLETNYDNELLKTSNMHHSYIQRLQSPLGHLSNSQAAELCSKFIKENQTIILSHISENVNSYNKAFNTIYSIIKEKNLQNINLKISYQLESTGWI